MPCNDCSRAEDCPPCVNEEAEDGCKHVSTEVGRPFWTPRGMRQSRWCSDCKAYVGVFEVEEPPMTVEEEEEAPPDLAPEEAADELIRHDQEAGLYEPAPPQPERRPPYAVAYSVNGHLFEVAVSGDATVQAIDGALVIRHHLGPVAGIVQVLPIIGKEGADGADIEEQDPSPVRAE